LTTDRFGAILSTRSCAWPARPRSPS